MNKFLSLSAAAAMVFAMGVGHAADGDAKTKQQSKMTTCNADPKAKELKGDERKAFMKECLSSGKQEKQQTKMGTCNKEATGMKGDERKAFMKNCLSNKPEAAATQQTKMKTCNAEAKTKALAGDERKAFMSSCLKD